MLGWWLSLFREEWQGESVYIQERILKMLLILKSWILKIGRVTCIFPLDWYSSLFTHVPVTFNTCHFVGLKWAYSHKIIPMVKAVPMSTNSRSLLLLCYFLFKHVSYEIVHFADFRCSAHYANCQLCVHQNSPYKDPFLRYKQDIISLEQFLPLSSTPALVTSILLSASMSFTWIY